MLVVVFLCLLSLYKSRVLARPVNGIEELLVQNLIFNILGIAILGGALYLLGVFVMTVFALFTSKDDWWATPNERNGGLDDSSGK